MENFIIFAVYVKDLRHESVKIGNDGTRMNSLTPIDYLPIGHFKPRFHFCIPWKRQKSSGFLTFLAWNS